MIMGKVIGNIWATRKEETLNGLKFLVVKPLDYGKESNAPAFIAIDVVGAGVGETVIVTKGSSARKVMGKGDIPVDASIVGIIDMVEVEKTYLD
ncbi:EutN/CcmL family microcompartment protein [Lutispora sp.]|jgi:ethanolamine utilization protein EutN|uniref:EutN/CcmL family microcompartment protein n=1 Tax=Lutispora sp. TaxID=2828727 RepID=UPI003562D950